MNMRSRRGAMALGLAILSNGVSMVIAGETMPNGVPVSTKRQISDCMSRHMAGDRTLSFIEAGKVCRDQVKAQAASAPLSPATKTIGAH